MMTASRRIRAVLLALTLFSTGAGALEISLEENKAERGNIGYIDLQKVFKLYPETNKAKQSYSEILRQAEEQVNLKKAELLTLRAELESAESELELLEKSPAPPAPTLERPAAISTRTPVAVSTAAMESAAPPVEAEVPGEPEDAVKPQAAEESPPRPRRDEHEIPPELRGLPGMSTPTRGESPEPAVTPAVGEDSLIINIPGVTEEPIIVAPPGEAEALRAAELAEMAKQARENTPSPVEAALTTSVTPESIAYQEALRSRDDARRILAKRVADAGWRLADAEKNFAAYQRQVERNLIEIESRRSEILLGKIYKTVREVARQEGVSVVVDKSQILYGQGSVDLTEKVIKQLEGSTR